MPNAKNKELVKTLKLKISKAKSIILADYIGISAAAANELRTKIKETKAEATVAKNTLLKVALKEEKVENKDLEKDLKGSTMAIFSYEDSIAPIKVIFDFAKKFELPKIKSAIIDGIYTTAEQVEAISKLPNKEQLIAQVLGGLKTPLYGLNNVLNGTKRKFVYALSALAEKKKGGAEA